MTSFVAVVTVVLLVNPTCRQGLCILSADSILALLFSRLRFKFLEAFLLHNFPCLENKIKSRKKIKKGHVLDKKEII